MSSISLSGVTLTYSGRHPVTALRGVDLAVPDGGFVAVLGPSGCGKTTLLRAIAGLEPPDGGTIRIGDVVVDEPGRHIAPDRRAVGLVPQEGALFPHLDVEQNVAFGLPRRPRADRARRVEEMLQLVGLPGAQRRRPHQLSGGQQQRVALARALAPGPDVVLLDEPFSALDAGLRVSLRDEVGKLLHRTGTTAVLVTHDQVEAMSMADQLAVMHDGAIVQTGPPAEVYRQPVDAWTGTFLGDAVRVHAQRDGDHHASGPLGRVRLMSDFEHHRGSEVSLFIRPEQVRLAAEREDGSVSAVVIGARFQGPEVLVDLALPRSDGLTVTARWPSTVRIEVGTPLRIAVEGPVLAHAPDLTGPGPAQASGPAEEPRRAAEE